MNLLTIACIVFSCVAASHLGLVAAVEETIHRRLPVVGCPKCCSFWVVLVLSCGGAATCGEGGTEGATQTATQVEAAATQVEAAATQVEATATCLEKVVATQAKAVAVAFLAAWAAVWVELAMGAIDKLYLKAYGKIYATTGAADADSDGASDALPDMRG